MLLRRDGTAVACGYNRWGQCDLPALSPGLTYTPHELPTLVLQASFEGDVLIFRTLVGEEICRFRAGPADRLSSIHDQLVTYPLGGRLNSTIARVDALLPGGQLLSRVPLGDTVASLFWC